jgi:hypothetical protein
VGPDGARDALDATRVALEQTAALLHGAPPTDPSLAAVAEHLAYPGWLGLGLFSLLPH